MSAEPGIAQGGAIRINKDVLSGGNSITLVVVQVLYIPRGFM